MWFIVGISGVTCSGKTTIANNLTRVLPNATCVSQDKYFLPEDSEHHVYIPELNHMNWELLTSVDMNQMMEDVTKIISNQVPVEPETRSILIIEGHTIFNYAPIANVCQLKFYLDLTKEQCAARRFVRTYDPPDVEGYFEQIVWPEHVKHMEEMTRNVQDVKMLDGTVDKDQLLDTVLNEIKMLSKTMY